MKALLQKIFFFLLLAGVGRLQAQSSFSATVSPTTAGKDDYIQLELSIQDPTAKPQVILPEMTDFTIEQGPMTGMSSQNINGVNTGLTYSFTYILKPRRTGKLHIPVATAIMNGTVLKSNPVQVNITARSANRNSNNLNNAASPFLPSDPFMDQSPQVAYNDNILRKGEDINEKIRKNVFLKVDLSKSSCYTGEPVIATYKLYTRLSSEGSVTQNPSFNGFSVVDMGQPDLQTYTREKLNGREYNVYIIRKSQLYPLRDGKLELEPAEVENNVHFIREEYARQQRSIADIFNDLDNSNIPREGEVSQKVAVRSDPVFVNVKALPEQTRPASFSGAVGHFEMSASVDKTSFTTDDAGLLRIVISGEGNMQLITAPQVTWPSGIDGFETKFTDKLVKETVPVSGTKTFEYPFTVSSPGTYTIPPVAFSFFDPASGAYRTLTSKPFEITITRGNGKPSDSVTIDQPEKERFFNHLFSNRWLVVVPLILIIIAGLFIWLRREKKKENALSKLALEKAAEQQAATEEQRLMEKKLMEEMADPLEKAKTVMEEGDAPKFYRSLNENMRLFLAKRFGIPAEDLNKKTIAEAMDKRGVDNLLSLQVQQLLDELEWQLYTPLADTAGIQPMCEKADDLVQQLKLSKV